MGVFIVFIPTILVRNLNLSCREFGYVGWNGRIVHMYSESDFIGYGLHIFNAKRVDSGGAGGLLGLRGLRVEISIYLLSPPLVDKTTIVARSCIWCLPSSGPGDPHRLIYIDELPSLYSLACSHCQPGAGKSIILAEALRLLRASKADINPRLTDSATPLPHLHLPSHPKSNNSPRPG